jgi:TolA-binding protein
MADAYARLKAEVERLTELNATLSLRYDATKSMLDGCAKEIEKMEAEIERLTSDLQMEKENEDRLVRLHQDARNEVERLTKAGDAMWNALLCSGCSECMGMYDCHDEAMKLWNAAKKGGQS